MLLGKNVDLITSAIRLPIKVIFLKFAQQAATHWHELKIEEEPYLFTVDSLSFITLKYAPHIRHPIWNSFSMNLSQDLFSV